MSLLDLRWTHDHDPAAPSRSISGTVVSVNGSISRLAAAAGLISIMSPAPKLCTAMHGADRRAVRRHGHKTDQIGMIKSVGFLDLRQPRTRNK